MAVHPHAGKLPRPRLWRISPRSSVPTIRNRLTRIRPHNVCLLERPGIVVLR